MNGAAATDQRPSLKYRLLRAVAGWGSVWVLVMAVCTGWVVQDEVDDLADAALQESAEWLYEVSLASPQVLRTLPEQARVPAHHEKLIWQWVDGQGQVLGRSHNAPAMPLRAPGEVGVSNAAGQWRVFGLALPNEQGVLLVADRLAERWTTRWRAAAVAIAVTVAMGFMFVLWLRRRIDTELGGLLHFSQQVVAFDPLHNPQALHHTAWEELLPIRDAVLTLGQRLWRRNQRERAFSAHAAHALRTPLAGMDAQLAMALRECPDALRPRLQRVREASNRLGGVVTSLLTLFRQRDQMRWESADVQDLLARTDLGGVRVEVLGQTLVDGDPDWLSVALINLVDNVARHGGNLVLVRVHLDMQFQLITLEDNGPGMPVERLNALNRALAAQNHEGGPMGLGLMLADWVARAHGGTVRLFNTGCGVRVEVLLRRQRRPTQSE